MKSKNISRAKNSTQCAFQAESRFTKNELAPTDIAPVYIESPLSSLLESDKYFEKQLISILTEMCRQLLQAEQRGCSNDSD